MSTGLSMISGNEKVTLAIVTVLLLALAGCALVAPSSSLVCPSATLNCALYTFGYEPSEPRCPFLGKFTDEIDFYFCRCDHERYAEELPNRARCIAEILKQKATKAYNEAVDVYNCRLTKDFCSPSSGTDYFNQPYFNRQPKVPECLSGGRLKFFDSGEANPCRADVEEFKAEIEQWAEQEADSVSSDAHQKSERAVNRFNCYARGGLVCL